MFSALTAFYPFVGVMVYKVQSSEVQGSTLPPAQKTAGQIEKETNEHWTLNNVFCLF